MSDARPMSFGASTIDAAKMGFGAIDDQSL